MFARLFQPRRARKSARLRKGHKPCLKVEALEHRTLLSTFVVDRLTDAGQGSDVAGDLRYCITYAADGDNIQFGVQGVINLTQNLPHLSHGISIQGSGQDVLTVSGDNHYLIFTVDKGTTVEISGLKL
jgi:hypothetical protein